MRTPRWALHFALLLGAAGCGPADPEAASDAAGGPPSQTPAASSTSEPLPTPSSSVAVLAHLLPDSLDGVELHTFAVGQSIIDRMASTLGIGVDDVEAAYASEHGARFFQTYALRVSGVDGARLLEAFVDSAYDPTEGDVTRDEATVGGKTVVVVSQPTTAARLGTFYAYRLDDVVLALQAFDPAVADEVLTALP